MKTLNLYSKTNLKIKIKSRLKKKGEKKAISEGFSSLSEFVKLVLTMYANNEISLKVVCK